MSVSPVVAITEVVAMQKAAKRHCSKAQAAVRSLLVAKSQNQLEQHVDALLARLRALDVALDPDWLTQWQQAHREANPRVKPARSSPPEDMTCRKCGTTYEDPKAFFMDDGQGEYGYTGRCVECRRKKRTQPPGTTTGRGG